MDVEIFGNKLCVYKNGTITKLRFPSDPSNNSCKLKKQTTNKTTGYNYIQLRCDSIAKKYDVHRIIASVYLDFDIDDSKIHIDHIDRNLSNNHINNLQLSNPSANAPNTNYRGYYWDKNAQKFKAQIILNNEAIPLGLFDSEDDAHNAYLEAKKPYE